MTQHEKLTYAPLKEVIFELRWAGEIESDGLSIDKGFSLAQGKFAEKLEKAFPVHRELFPSQVHRNIFGLPIHQYWQGEMIWPVIQHGQGIISINQVEEGYDWHNHFAPLVEDILIKLNESYEGALIPKKLKLQYIDAFELNSELDFEDFITNNLQISVKRNFELNGKITSSSLSQSFEFEGNNQFHLNIATGKNNETNSPAIILTTTIENKHTQSLNEVKTWIDIAHSITSNSFKNILSSEFYASLK